MLATLLPFVLTAPLLLTAPGTQATKQPPPAPKAAPAPAAAKGAARTIEITGGDDMKYNVTALTAKPGETIRIVLKNIGTMPKIAMAHNFVLLKATAKPDAFANAAMTASATGYIPAANKGDVIANTTLVGPGETAEVTFKVPAAGSYPFLCSFPGHFTLMKGTLTVK